MLPSPGRWARLALIVFALAAFVVGAAFLPIQPWLARLSTMLQAGPANVMAFAAIFGLLAMALVPVAPLALVAGAVYGAWAIPFVWGLMMAVSALSFELGRTWLASPVERAIAGRPLLKAVAEVIGEEGWRMVLLVRLSGVVPFGVQNYVFGATRVSFGGFLLATSVGIWPVILLYGGAGAFAGAAAEGAPGGLLRAAFLALAAVAALVLVILTGRKVRARLREARRTGQAA